jgi:hypothetical protein
MHKSLALFVGLVICSSVKAQTITDPDRVAEQLQFWTQTDADPVYYGEMMDGRGRHMACLELAFIKYEDHVLHYLHKMWPKHNGSCEYTDQTSRKVDNSQLCVADSEKPGPRATTTTRMTKQNINLDRSVFRTMDFPRRRAGQLLPCRGQTLAQAKELGYLGSAGIVSVKIENGQFKLQTTAPRIYRVRLQPTDPRDPPTDRVF